MEKTLARTLTAIWQSYHDGFLAILPGLLAAFIIIFAGWVLALLLSWVIRRALKMTRFDQFCGNSGFTHLLNKADIHAPPSILAGKLIFWLVFLVFIMSGLNALGMELFKRLASEFLLYLPNVFTAALILLAGALGGSFLSRAALLGAVNANLPSPRTISLMVKYAILVLCSAMALEQLKIAGNIVMAAFTIAFGAVMLGLAIAFGLGGRHAARRILEERMAKKTEEQNNGFDHL
jgi:hypothetical protein